MTAHVVLGIDTSGAAGSVALLGESADGLRISVEEIFTEGLIHGVALAPAVEEILGRFGLAPADLALVAVGTGPGSYTGVRVAVSFAKSLAYAAGVPSLGVPSLDAIADAAPPAGIVACVRDARRGSLYLGLYREGADGRVRDGAIRLVRNEDFDREVPRGALVLGDAVERFPDLLSGGGRTLGDTAHSRAPALSVARLGRRRAASGTQPAHDLAPVYLRLSEAEERRGEGKADA